MRVGFGFDVHPFTDDPAKRLVIGGVTFEGESGLKGHSDSDVIAHAIADSLLGAACLGDLGNHFPDTDPEFKGADSLGLLAQVVTKVRSEGWVISNVDTTILAERPKIAPSRAEMEQRLRVVLGAPVSVKATRAEGLGSIGRVEGIACWAVALLEGNENEGKGGS